MSIVIIFGKTAGILKKFKGRLWRSSNENGNCVEVQQFDTTNIDFDDGVVPEADKCVFDGLPKRDS